MLGPPHMQFFYFPPTLHISNPPAAPPPSGWGGGNLNPNCTKHQETSMLHPPCLPPCPPPPHPYHAGGKYPGWYG